MRCSFSSGVQRAVWYRIEDRVEDHVVELSPDWSVADHVDFAVDSVVDQRIPLWAVYRAAASAGGRR